MFQIINFYHFFPFPEPAQDAFIEQLRAIEQRDPTLGGLVLVSREGVNITVASQGDGASAVLTCCGAYTDLSQTLIKRHTASRRPFRRFTIDKRVEIITYRGEDSLGDPLLFAGPNETFLSPEEWHQLLDSNEPLALIDTRNDYEVELGTFRGAENPKIQRFSDLAAWLEQNPPPRDKKVLVFCTGGVRCEKVVVDLKGKGYDQVYQLQGGILAYLEKFPEKYFDGECFVFDHRVSVDQHLNPSRLNHLCNLCGDPTTEERSCTQCGTQAAICDSCASQESGIACSKNCRYHLQRQSERGSPSRRALVGGLVAE